MSAIEDLEIIEEGMLGVAPDTSGDPVPPESLAEANRWLGHLRRLRRRKEEFLAVANDQREQLELAIQSQVSRYDGQAVWFEQALKGFHQVILDAEPDRTTIPLTNGELKKTHGGVEWEVFDPGAFLVWARKNRPSIVHRSDPPPERPDREEMKRQLKAAALAGGSGPQRPRFEEGHIILDGGEVVPGVRVTAKEDKFVANPRLD